MHAAKTTRPRAAQQTQQERLGLVVPGMRHGNRGCPQPRGRTIEKGVARDVRGVLDRHVPGAREPGDIDALDIDRDPEAVSESAAEPLVAVGFGPAKLMIQMRGADHPKALFPGDVLQRKQQSHRIGATRQRDSHAAAPWQQAMAADRSASGSSDGHA
jgi:hypothetical protein